MKKVTTLNGKNISYNSLIAAENTLNPRVTHSRPASEKDMFATPFENIDQLIQYFKIKYQSRYNDLVEQFKKTRYSNSAEQKADIVYKNLVTELLRQLNFSTYLLNEKITNEEHITFSYFEASKNVKKVMIDGKELKFNKLIKFLPILKKEFLGNSIDGKLSTISFKHQIDLIQLITYNAQNKTKSGTKVKLNMKALINERESTAYSQYNIQEQIELQASIYEAFVYIKYNITESGRTYAAAQCIPKKIRALQYSGQTQMDLNCSSQSVFVMLATELKPSIKLPLLKQYVSNKTKFRKQMASLIQNEIENKCDFILDEQTCLFLSKTLPIIITFGAVTGLTNYSAVHREIMQTLSHLKNIDKIMLSALIQDCMADLIKELKLARNVIVKEYKKDNKFVTKLFPKLKMRKMKCPKPTAAQISSHVYQCIESQIIAKCCETLKVTLNLHDGFITNESVYVVNKSCESAIKALEITDHINFEVEIL